MHPSTKKTTHEMMRHGCSHIPISPTNTKTTPNNYNGSNTNYTLAMKCNSICNILRGLELPCRAHSPNFDYTYAYHSGVNLPNCKFGSDTALYHAHGLSVSKYKSVTLTTIHKTKFTTTTNHLQRDQ